MIKHLISVTKHEVWLRPPETTLNKSRLLLFCGCIVAALMVWVGGASGLGPLDDHNFIRTIFQGKDFDPYIFPNLGRFFPLTAQEYVLAAGLIGPSGQLFYLIEALKIALFGGLLFSVLNLTELGNFASAILWSSAVFSIGIANTLFRLSAGEFNLIILLLLFAVCALKLLPRSDAQESKSIGYAIIGIFAFSLTVFYKELAFVFGLIFALSEMARSYWVRKSKPSVFISATLFISVLYIVCYGIWRYFYVTGSYTSFLATSPLSVLALYANNDPFIIFVVLPVALYRVSVIVRKREQYSIYDSFLFAASAYVGAYLLLAIFNTYYFLPTYAFGVCGIAGVVGGHSNKIVRHAILTLVVLCEVNVLPVALSDIQSQKNIADNHFKFVSSLSEWLETSADRAPNMRNIVLVGVSPGSGAEILYSLKIFLISLGTPQSAFEIKTTEPSDNKAISDFYGFNTVEGYKPVIGDLLVFNPYQSSMISPPLSAPSYTEIYRSGSEWALPRWNSLQWIKVCLIQRGDCVAKTSENMRYVGYAALLVNRVAVPITEAQPLKSPAYRLGSLRMPVRIRCDARTNLVVTVENTGTEIWPADGTLRSGMFVNLAYRWFDENGHLVLEGDRTAFPEPMWPSDFARVSILLKAPALPGKYRLAIGPVQEGVQWFANADLREIEVY